MSTSHRDPAFCAIEGAIGIILDELNIQYDYCAGVSSFCGAASALKTEYTLPNVSQSVIITRCEGRTPVPKGQSLKELAVHKATNGYIFKCITYRKGSKGLNRGWL